MKRDMTINVEWEEFTTKEIDAVEHQSRLRTSIHFYIERFAQLPPVGLLLADAYNDACTIERVYWEGNEHNDHVYVFVKFP